MCSFEYYISDSLGFTTAYVDVYHKNSVKGHGPTGSCD